jgi:hypothetical protein
MVKAIKAKNGNHIKRHLLFYFMEMVVHVRIVDLLDDTN